MPYEKFNLIIGSERIDSGKYEYSLSAEQFIKDRRGSIKKLRDIKDGVTKSENSDIVEAKYSIADNNLNKKALHFAYEAFMIFKKLPLSLRKKILIKIISTISEHKNEILRFMKHDGLPLAVAEWEFREMISAFSMANLDFYCNDIIREFKIKERKEKILLYRKPDGVVGVILPKNAPLSSSFLSLFALLTGNTLILKPPYKNPISVLYVWDIIDKILFEETKVKGIINVIVGNSKDIAEEWLNNDEINDILFYGSSAAGIEFAKKAFNKNKKTILELSGNDFCVVWDNRRIDESVDSFLDGFIGSSQVCMLPRIALVNDENYAQFISRVESKMKNECFSPINKNKTILSPVGNVNKFFELYNDAISKGAKCLTGGKRINNSGVEDDNGHYIQPCIITIQDAEAIKQMRIYSEETFVPLITIVRIKGSDKDKIFSRICELINNNPFGLRTSVWVSDEGYKERFIHELDNCGMLRINSRHIEFSDYLPTHGGLKMTGGIYGGLNYFWEKTSHLQGISIK